MAADLQRQQSLVIEKERLKRELELSRQIQPEMLPRSQLRGTMAEIAGVSVPAREVGGDFFNYFDLPDGRLALPDPRGRRSAGAHLPRRRRAAGRCDNDGAAGYRTRSPSTTRMTPSVSRASCRARVRSASLRT